MTDKSLIKVPYTIGAVFTIQKAAPPGITEATPGSEPNPVLSQHDNSTYQLKITETLRVGQDLDAQTVLCQVSPAIGQRQGQILVAKIWDHVLRERPDWMTQSARALAELDYNTEREAYECIAASQYDPPWKCVPQYYGAWSFRCPEGSDSSARPPRRANRRTQERVLPLVLLELIDGCTAYSLTEGHDYPYCNEDYQLYVWARVLEIESWLEHIGVTHSDIAIQNVMIDPAPMLPTSTAHNSESALVALQNSRLPRIILFDFDAAILHSASNSPKPESPINRYWSNRYSRFHSWLPDWWRNDIPRRRKWLLQEFSKNEYLGMASPEKCLMYVNVLTPKEENDMEDYGVELPK